MSKQTNSDGFEWDELWAGFNGQPTVIKKAWMQTLEPVLKSFMLHSSKKIQDEVFSCAPDAVKKYFGYGVAVQAVNSQPDRKKLLQELQNAMR